MDRNLISKKEEIAVQEKFTDGYIVYACVTVLIPKDESSFTSRQEAGFDSFWIEKSDAINRAQEIMNNYKNRKWKFLFYEEREQLAWVNGEEDSITVYPMKACIK